MPPVGTALAETVDRIARRDNARAEATLQADIRQFLLLSKFDLDADEVREINLESQLGDGTRRRIDIEVGDTVIEVKKDLRVGNVLNDAVAQLTGYVAQQSIRLGRRYVGILTDGVDWRLFHLNTDGTALSQVSQLTLSATDGVDRLTTWLDAVLATATGISPLPLEIERRLGVGSASYMLDHASLTDLYTQAVDLPEVQLKRELWAKLLRTSFGTAFADSEPLFIDHTLLVLTAEIIAHAVVGYDLAERALIPEVLVSGSDFAAAQIHGVVEADFFDWVLHAPGGPAFVTSLARRLARFNWRDVQHDVLKVLYESVISPQTRHSLGEYYTPDWLADRIVAEVVTQPLEQRVLDPACGSGTFLFQAVRRYLDAAEKAEMPVAESIEGVTRNVVGVDVHPVAVTFARVTYLLAIGADRLRHPDRPPLTIPVYLGDSIQWDQRTGGLSSGTINIPTSGNDLSDVPTGFLFETDLAFPESIVDDAAKFDRIVSELADKAVTYTGGEVPKVRGLLKRHGISDEDVAVLSETFNTWCNLHATGRDHIWGYYVRNLIRPLWLSSSDEHRVDVLVGNPPWLRYGAMTASMQERFTTLSQDRNLITTRRGVSGRDLSSLFVVRAIELYLRPGGKFGFVMPHAALTRKPYEGFRTGSWASANVGDLAATFNIPWDLAKVRPDIFPVPASVVFGSATPGKATALTEETLAWRGRLPATTVTWAVASERLTVEESSVRAVAESDTTPESPYKDRFRQGAVLAPRALLFVEESDHMPLGAGAGRTAVRAFRSPQEKEPWKSVPTLVGSLESQFLFPTYLGETVLPFRTVTPRLAALPIRDGAILTEIEIEGTSGLSAWWEPAEALWQEHKSAADDSHLVDRIDFHGQLSAQLPQGTSQLIGYTKAGTRLTAARISDERAIIDHKLYWARADSPAEARYLCTILNSQTVLDRVIPFMGQGLFGPRDFDKYVFRVPIPTYDDMDEGHVALAALGAEAEAVAGTLDVRGLPFKQARSQIRLVLEDAGVSDRIEAAVSRLLPQ